MGELWFTIWFLVILKIPAVYLAYVIWWAVKDPPTAVAPAGGGEADGGDPGWWRDRRRRGHPPRRGPHGAPSRRADRTQAPSRTRSRA